MEGVDTKTFIIVNGLIVGLIALSFLLLRKGPRPPVKLDLHRTDMPPAVPSEFLAKAEAKAPVPRGDQVSKRPPGWDNYRPRRARVTGSTARAEPLENEKPLNVMFNWNGHTWDAYEVLGLPAGSSSASVDSAYVRMRQTCDPESVPFIEAAYRAIKSA